MKILASRQRPMFQLIFQEESDNPLEPIADKYKWVKDKAIFYIKEFDLFLSFPFLGLGWCDFTINSRDNIFIDRRVNDIKLLYPKFKRINNTSTLFAATLVYQECRWFMLTEFDFSLPEAFIIFE